MKKIFVHSPYWLTKGGGERYSLTAAECLTENFEVLADGVGSITGGFMAEWRRFGLGKYTTAITMSVGEEIVHKEIDFWVFPWKTTSLAGLLVLGTLSISKWGKLRKRKK